MILPNNGPAPAPAPKPTAATPPPKKPGILDRLLGGSRSSKDSGSATGKPSNARERLQARLLRETNAARAKLGMPPVSADAVEHLSQDNTDERKKVLSSAIEHLFKAYAHGVSKGFAQEETAQGFAVANALFGHALALKYGVSMKYAEEVGFVGSLVGVGVCKKSREKVAREAEEKRNAKSAASASRGAPPKGPTRAVPERDAPEEPEDVA